MWRVWKKPASRVSPWTVVMAGTEAEARRRYALEVQGLAAGHLLLVDPEGRPVLSLYLAPVALTARQASDYLSISRRTLYRMVARGELPPPVRRSKRWVRFRREDLEAFLSREEALAQ